MNGTMVRDLVIAVALAAAIAAVVLLTRTEAMPSVADPENDTLSEVALHNGRESCWTVINGGVYDLTSWIPEHPGGEEAILKLCGIDGSSIFNNQHGGSARQETILSSFRIGSVGDTH